VSRRGVLTLAFILAGAMAAAWMCLAAVLPSAG